MLESLLGINFWYSFLGGHDDGKTIMQTKDEASAWSGFNFREGELIGEWGENHRLFVS